MNKQIKPKGLGQILVSQEKLEPENLRRFSEEANTTGQALGIFLLKTRKITPQDLAAAYAEQYNLPCFDLKDFKIPPQFLEEIEIALMYRYPFVPIHESEGLLTLVISDPSNLAAIDELELSLKKEIRFAIAPKEDILDVLKRSEGSGQVLRKMEADLRPELLRDEEDEEVLSIEQLTKDQSPVVKLVNTLLLNALQKRASDIHIELTESQVITRYRIDGVLYPAMEPLDIQFHAALVSRLKVMSELDITEKRIPQDGRFKIRLENKKVDFRVSILPSLFGEDVVIRILDKEYITADIAELKLDRLGFNPEDLRRFKRAIQEPYGMVLVTGPTGSGKTTTLYAAITEISTSEDKIITIEDPAEYELQGIVQIPVNEKKGLTFARGLRSILRHDPDKIMVGEIRDTETAQIAIQSALTGHLVFTTVHANNAFDVIGRFVNMGIEPYNFVSSLNCILAQRLVRILCTSCKIKGSASVSLLEASGLNPAQYADTDFYDAPGCSDCHETGFKGRKGITEFLDLSDEIRDMILSRRPPGEIQKAALKKGMTTLRQAGLEKVFKGETTLREINRVTFID